MPENSSGNGNGNGNGGKAAPPPAGGTGGSGGTGSTGGSSGTGGTGSTDNSGSVGRILSTVGVTLLKVAVGATRYAIVPVAEAYTRDGAETPPREGGVLTPAERTALFRAGEKLIWEVGTILTTNHPVVEGGVPGGQQGPKDGRYPQPSVAYVLSAVKAASAFWQARTERQAQEARVAAARAENEQQTPVPVSVLRGRR